MTDVTVPPGDLPTTLDPIELALEAEAAGLPADDPARLVLVRHARLLERQITSEATRIASERITLGLKALAGVAALVVAGLLGMLVWDASNERGLVIEPFSVPPEFAERGLTGQVVASKVLDRLSEMQEATPSNRAPNTYANNWNGDIRVQIPETGVSVGELRRLLVQWLGRQTSISGEIYRTPEGGLALSARTGTAAAKTHKGTDAELDALIQAAAEDVYAVTQPYRYALYVDRTGDMESVRRSQALLRRLILAGAPEDRLWAYTALSLRLFTADGDAPAALRTVTAAIEQEPRFGMAWSDRSTLRQLLGHDEAALADSRTALETMRERGERFLDPAALAYLVPGEAAIVAELTGDYAGAARGYQEAARLSGQDWYLPSLINAQAAGHDLAAARDSRAQIPPPQAGADPRARAVTAWSTAYVDAALALALEDWRGLATALDSVDETVLQAGERIELRSNMTPYVAVGMARLGDADGAQALIETTPTDCYTCVRMRGVVASAAGDWAGADRWFTEAVRQGPSLPFAYADWGESLMARGRYDAAIARFRQAAEKGPRWADPLELWGEALMKKGDWAGAVEQFAAADKLAPKWGRNHLRWGEALLKLGRRAEAGAQFRAARALDLSEGDRAQLQALTTPLARKS
ncbi:hypothetical protein [Caulobacter sp. 17J65-9]|uniref:hypothetical protein n=1 Tax=Caulobacter sp. 17J65-9 TaxID=2709382 RepID=UPI0013CB2F25|nr:hypothetical protein [Caulobacter sp. 17J65-9]NEX94968.1 hypothetical protein [Caulobacter sp. 17J65-9]